MVYRSSFSIMAVTALATTLAGGLQVSQAATANGPICDTAAKVNSTTYYSCSGGSHTALDIANGTCSVWNHRAMLVGSYRYTLYAGCANSCGACTAGAGCCSDNTPRVGSVKVRVYRKFQDQPTCASYTVTATNM